jgi:hypothetical protein
MPKATHKFIDAGHLYMPRTGRKHTGNQVQQGAFTTARWADKRDKFAPVDRKIHIFKDVCALVLKTDARNGQERIL